MPILNFPPGVAKFSVLRGKLRESKSTIFFLIHLGNPFSITILGRNSTCEAVEARGQFWICPRTASFPDPEEKGGILTLLTSFPTLVLFRREAFQVSKTMALWEYLFRGEPRRVGGGPAAARRGSPVLALARRECLGAALDLLQLVLALPRLEEDLRVLPLLGLQEDKSE